MVSEINEISSTEGFFNVPVEATAFVAAVSAFAVLLLIFVMYLNKKYRFFSVNLVPRQSKAIVCSGILPPPSPSSSASKPIPLTDKLRTQLGEEYSGTPESSSDSEEDVLRRLKQLSGKSFHQMPITPSSSASYQHHSTPFTSRGYTMEQSPHLHLHTTPRQNIQQHYPPQHQYSKLYHFHQHRSLDLGPSIRGSPPVTDRYSHVGGIHGSPLLDKSSLLSSGSRQAHHTTGIGSVVAGTSHLTGNPGVRPLRVTLIRDVQDIGTNGTYGNGTSLPSSSSRRRTQAGLSRAATLGGRAVTTDGNDLISLAEKGKVCGGSSASSTSSNVSADMDELHRQHPGRHGPLILPQRQRHHLPHQPHSTESQLSNTSSHSHQVLQRSMSRDREPPQRELNPSSRPHPVTIPSGPHSQYRRMILPPRTKSMDSESPPPSEQGLSTYGDSLADQDDHIFEVEEMSLTEGDLGMIVETNRESSSSVPCGSVEVAFDYEAPEKKMTVHVIQARGIPSKDVGGADNSQIRVVLLPGKKNRQKTKARPGENPQFLESFVFGKVNPEDVSSLGIRLRLYGCERMRRERLLGECILGFGSFHFEMETTIWLNFEPRYHLALDSQSDSGSLARSDSASSTQSIQNGIPELLVGLAYNGTTGRLTVEIIKGSHFRNLAGGKAPDSYVKLVLVSCNGQEMGRAKSSLRRAQSNPLFKETFMFQVALFQVSEVTLLVSVYGRKGVTRRELLGWFALGYNSSGDEESTHWEDMCDAQGDQMCRWHVLLQS